MAQIPACKCCGAYRTSPKLAVIVECLEYRYDSLWYSSATRCEKHNRDEHGSKVSGHLPIWGPRGDESVAIDIHFKVWSNSSAKSLVMDAVRMGAMGVEINYDKQYIHIDLKPRIYWFKILNGKEIPFFEG